MLELSEPYVMGLLTEAERGVPKLRDELVQSRERALRIDPELSSLVKRLDASRAAGEDLEASIDNAGTEVSEKNMRVASAHQEIAMLKRRADDLKVEMDRVGPGAIHSRLRRDRAKLLVQIEDRESEINRLREEIEAARGTLAAAEAGLLAEKDKHRFVMKELDKLQSQLPAPHLYMRLFEYRVARAHCRLFLEHNVSAWEREVTEAIGLVVELHRELRAGKYRLDKNSDVVGGRAVATAEAIFGSALLGNYAKAVELFNSATDPGVYFHQILNVFRVWCLGLYLADRHQELTELLRLHQYAQGLRGGYVQAFIGLLQREPRRVAAGLKIIARHESEVWLDPTSPRGAAVVNVGGAAIARLAFDRGLAVELPGPTLPLELIAAGTVRKSAPRTLRE